MGGSGWLGIILIIIGSTGNNLGNNLVSMAHQQKIDADNEKKKIEKEEKKREKQQGKFEVSSTTKTDASEFPVKTEDLPPLEPEKEKCCCYDCGWREIGTIIFVVGNLFTFASFGFGSQSTLAALESVQFVTNVFFVKFIQKQPITLRMLIATFMIVGGVVIVVLFGEHAAIAYDSSDMRRLYRENTTYHVYLVVGTIFFIITFAVYQKYYHSRMIVGKLLWRHSFLEPFCFSVSAALVGTLAVLKSKCMALMLKATGNGQKNEFASWYLYFTLAIWLFLVAFWLNRLDTGLAMYPPMFIIPVMQVFFVLFAILCGGLYFKEFSGFTTSNYIGFFVGVVMILSGVYGLAPPDMELRIKQEEEEEEDSNYKEEIYKKEVNATNLDLEKGANCLEKIKPKPESSAKSSPRDNKIVPDPIEPPKDTVNSPFGKPIKDKEEKQALQHNDNQLTMPKMMSETSESVTDTSPKKKNRKVVKRGTSPPPVLAPLRVAPGVQAYAEKQEETIVRSSDDV